MRHRVIAASLLALVLVPLFGIVDYFMYRPNFPTLVGARILSCIASTLILLCGRRSLGRRHPSELAVALGLQVGLTIACVPVFVTGPNAPHYVGMALLILSLAALFPWPARQVAFLSVTLATVFFAGALLHGVSRPGEFVTQASAIAVTSVIATIIAGFSEVMRAREFAARRALRSASREKTRLIHDLQRKTAELARLNLQLGTLNQEMEDFLYVASHDLRSPLINVQGFANEVRLGVSDLRAHSNSVLEAKALHGEIEESLRFIDTATQRMDGLIKGLLSVSRVATRTNLTEAVSLQRVVEQIVESFRYQLDQRGIRVTVGELPTVLGDALRINQVFSNLIDNAIKYIGHATQPAIAIGVRNGDGPPTFFVTDNGPGIPPENHETVFRLFRRLTRDVAGEGLGLTMVRKIVQKHGGRIWIESAPGTGSTFCFTLQASADATSRIRMDMHEATTEPEGEA